MSFFDRQGIPDSLLYQTYSEGTKDQASPPDDESGASSVSGIELDGKQEEDIAVLRKFSLISVDVDGSTFQIHRLVQLAVRAWVETSGSLESYKQLYIERLCAAFPLVSHKNWGRCQLLFAHAEAAVEQILTDERFLVHWARLLYGAATYAWRKGAYKTAEKILCRSIHRTEKVLGNDAPIVLDSVDQLGNIFNEKGKYGEAEELHERARIGFHSTLGPEDPKTLGSLNGIAITRINRGSLKEAESLQT